MAKNTPEENLLDAIIEKCVLEERERCAKVCDSMGVGYSNAHGRLISREVATELAAAIRALK